MTFKTCQATACLLTDVTNEFVTRIVVCHDVCILVHPHMQFKTHSTLADFVADLTLMDQHGIVIGVSPGLMYSCM